MLARRTTTLQRRFLRLRRLRARFDVRGGAVLLLERSDGGAASSGVKVEPCRSWVSKLVQRQRHALLPVSVSVYVFERSFFISLSLSLCHHITQTLAKKLLRLGAVALLRTWVRIIHFFVNVFTHSLILFVWSLATVKPDLSKSSRVTCIINK